MHGLGPPQVRPLNLGRRFVIGLPFAWLTVFFLVPFFILL
jgi:hypothetical protein